MSRIEPVNIAEVYSDLLLYAEVWHCKKDADRASLVYLAENNTTYLIFSKGRDVLDCDYMITFRGNLEHLDNHGVVSYPLTSSSKAANELSAAAAPFILKGFDIALRNEDGTPGETILRTTGLTGVTFNEFLNDIIRLRDPSESYQRLVALLDDNTTATGSRLADRFDTGGGDDTITTGAGEDRVYKWRSGDLDFDGGAGRDFLIFSPFDGDIPTPPKGAVVDLTRGTGLNPFGGKLTLKGVEDVAGTFLADNLRGNAHDNVLLGDAGNDRLKGEGGDDQFTFGEGFDGDYRGATIDGGAGIDSVSAFGSGSETNRLDVLNQDLNTGIFRGGSFTNLESFRFSSDFNPFVVFDLKGGNVAESFHAGSNADSIDGRGGDDLIRGMGGGDRLEGGAGQDTLDYSLEESFGGVNINLQANKASGGDAEGDKIAGFEHATGSRYADRITGSAIGNRLDALDGNDTVEGGGGADWIVGGGGLDRLTGGGGPDRFVFLSAFESGSTRQTADIITDFGAVDVIDLSGIDAIPGGADDAFVFRGGRAFTGEGQVRVVEAGGFTFIELNSQGSSTPDSIIRLNGEVSLAAGDFVL